MEALTENLVRRYAALFTGFNNRFGSYEIHPNQPKGKQEGIAKTLAGPLLPSSYLEHLKGIKGLGIIPLLDDNYSAKFGCIDIDKYPIDFAALERDCAQIPVTITRSKSGGAHVWLFTKEPVSAELLQRVLKLWAAGLGFGKSEIFPKQIARKAADDAGNWINLPFFGGARLAFFNGKERNLEEFLDHVEASRLMNDTTLESFILTEDEKSIFHDGPPCLDTLTKKGISPGTRNIVMMNVGSYFKRKDPDTFLANLLDFNRKHLADPLPETEITSSIAKSLNRKTYNYQCGTEPLCSACNRSACLKRTFGVGGQSEELTITLTGLTKIRTEPPIWYVNIDGVRVQIPDLEVLLNQRAFRTLAAETINKLFQYIKVSAWEKMVGELLEHVEEIDAPPDSSFGGQLGEEIRSFIQMYAQEDSFEQITARTVYIDRKQNRAYFKSIDLVKKLRRELGPVASVQKTWAYLKYNETYAAENAEYELGGVGKIRLWSISLDYIYIPTIGLGPPVRMLEQGDPHAIPF